MITLALVVVLRLVVLHTVDGREIVINPAQVTSMRETKDDEASNRAFTKQVRCMVSLADGKYVTVVEECDTVRHKIEEAGR